MTTKNMIKLIIFDLDGVLIDSQPLQYEAYNKVFSKYGFPISEEEWEEDWIHGSISCEGWIKKKGLPLDFAKMRAEKKEIYEKLIVTDLKLKSGVNEAINLLSDNYLLCIASASRKSAIDAIDKRFGFSKKFQKITSDQETNIKRPKPYPDVFLHVADAMGVLPEECLVIEDSVAGLQAAKSAGMRCIVCPDSFCKTDPSEFKDADKIVNSLRDINLETIYQLEKI